MSKKDNIAPAPESQEKKEGEPAKSKAAPEGGKPEGGKEETIGEALGTEQKPTPKEDGETVPLATFLEVKNTAKELAREIGELKQAMKDGASKSEMTADLKALAEKYPDTDPEFFRDLAKTLRAEIKGEMETEVDRKLKPLQEKERAEKIDKAFSAAFDKAMQDLPDYAKIVDKETIKALSLLPSNANKTFTQLIEASYGHLIGEKKTIDAGSHNANKDTDGDVDVERAKKDPEYFKQVMANPTLKKKYNDSLTDRLSSVL